ncbi:acetyl-CoA carboxylase biotin carboxyl carrier protein subunit [Corynebacterium sp. ES2794-CONJ1]|uniref:acetyl-CoA carboxylase biotin carboxyl carrier protein subunit n=1 Tax=unclassified Corynebacterium TaxID=2624378 RepID=UPI0021670836|nr:MULTISPECIES: acetyl-CoA carboxylase biotin carboxyl carrier protein subunit [unclassified Corynebacterium]MCS4490728.1 acetyl-CoA carboxylase biotin carboxyl carrier protein subunit [Corynebacterium sp. ES2775-CONJ]MCS4492530.1 acetyl-CoA carboxylase biotin carboxyl carrier protein subunit [Corynebacterium sp. ES2715-CONJ3]MCS4532631.1 acetyl-CoA carboxylase biotin carboxyl carrier protein subunit [Corynebacterium sp. ES2730-CONJ]MCU9520026.1 acetyl-CoA carboxylase biotin carboxyl carrier p
MKICAPFLGIVRYTVAVGDRVETGAELAIVEAVKLETSIVAPGPGIVSELCFNDFEDVLGGDPLLVIAEEG